MTSLSPESVLLAAIAAVGIAVLACGVLIWLVLRRRPSPARQSLMVEYFSKSIRGKPESDSSEVARLEDIMIAISGDARAGPGTQATPMAPESSEAQLTQERLSVHKPTQEKRAR